MAINYSYQLRTNKVAQTQITVGSSGMLKIFSGSEPANCAAADPAGLLCKINLPSVFMQSSGGIGTLVGNWSGVGTAIGFASCFRIYDVSGTCHVQGNVTTDLVMQSTAIGIGQPVFVTGFSVTAPGEGVPVIPPVGTLAVTEANDFLLQPVRGTLLITEVGDALSGRPVFGSLTITEAPDVVSAQGVIPNGTLTRSSVNPRYFFLNNQAVWVAGSDTFDVLQAQGGGMTQDIWINDEVIPQLVQSKSGVGLQRIWAFQSAVSDGPLPDSELPFVRSSTPGGPNGGNKFDLTQYNPTFDTNLFNLVSRYGNLGIHCQIILFSGTWDNTPWSAWDPFYTGNNINGSNASSGITQQSTESGQSATTLALEKAYVTHLVTLLYNLPNVTWEICNEIWEDSGSLAWISLMVSQIRNTEISLGGVRHLVMQGAGAAYEGPTWGGTNPTFANTEVDYVCSGWGDTAPYDGFGGGGDIALGGPNGNQVVVLDTDHSLVSGNQSRANNVWIALTRGWGGFIHMAVGGPSSIVNNAQNFLYGPNAYISGNDNSLSMASTADSSTYFGILGTTRAVSLITSLNGMAPGDNFSSTTYCLLDNTNLQYIIYQPNGASSFTVNLSSAAGNSLLQSWIDVTTGLQIGSTVNYLATSSNAQTFNPPANGGAVGLILSRGIPVPALIVANPGSQIVGTAFQVQVTIQGYSGAPTLQYGFDNATWSALPGGATVTATSATFNLTISSAGTDTIWVRDQNNIAVKGNSGTFGVTTTGGGVTLSLGYGGTYMNEPANSPGNYPSPTQLRAATGCARLPNVVGTFSYNRSGTGPFFIGGYNAAGVNAAAQMSYIDGAFLTCGFAGSGCTPGDYVAGNLDGVMTGWIDFLFNSGFSRQKGYNGFIYVRINWEPNYWGNTPGGYDAVHANGGSWNAITGSGPGYWFNTGTTSAIGGSPSLAGFDGTGNFWAWQHMYKIMSFNFNGSYAQQKGVPIEIVWNPTAQNNYTPSDGSNFIYQSPINMYPGDQYCDVHAIDIYSNHFYGLAGAGGSGQNALCTTYPGYASATPFTRNWPTGPEVPYSQWALSNDNIWHALDFLDSTASFPDGMPLNGGPDPTLLGNGSQMGWGMAKAAMWANASGLFAGAVDPVSGLPRVKKPFIIPECGGYQGGGDYGDVPLTNENGPVPAFMTGFPLGGDEDMGYWPWMASRVQYMQQVMGIDVQALIIWNLAAGTVETARMMSSFGPAFSGL